MNPLEPPEDSPGTERSAPFLVRSPKLILACVAVAAGGVVLAGEPAAATPGRQLKAKAAEARQVLREVNLLDLQFGRTVEAWNGARFELARTRKQLAADQVLLRIAERQQRIAEARVKARLVALYESSDDPTTIGILLGSSTVSDMLGRLDAAHTISSADHQLAVETTAARNTYAATERRTRATERRRAAAVTQLEVKRSQIGSMLTQRRTLLASVQSQIATLRAEEAQRQAMLAAEARARLAREQAALRAQAEARAAAAARTAAQPAPTPRVAPVPAPTTSTLSTVTTDPLVAPAQSTTNAGAGHPDAASIAMHYLGVPYVWGGSTPGGFDCSGLVMYVYGQLGITLPHFAAAQYGYGAPVSRDELQPGDLVFFDGLNHVGIYIGGGEMIHAPHTGDVVKISPLAEFGSGYVGARRI